MKRNLILKLILLTLFTTGCSVNYNLEIEDGNITEITTLSEQENGIYTKSYMYSQYQEEHPIYIDEEYLYYAPNEKIEGNTYYEKSIEEQSNGYKATYKATYTLDDFERARSLNIAYKNFSIGYNNNEDCYIIIADNFKLFNTNEYLTDVTININLKGYDVIESNHNSKSGTVYTWNITKKSDDNILLKFIEEKEEDNPNNIVPDDDSENNNKTPDYTIYIFYAALIILILIGYLIFKHFKNKNNNFDDD